MTMPRVLGYAFNPLSGYFCYHGADGRLVAVLYEVQQYLRPAPQLSGRGRRRRRTARSAQRAGKGVLRLAVSWRWTCPTISRSSRPAERMCALDHRAASGAPVIAAALSGERARADGRGARQGLPVAFRLMTLKVVAGIHWEAFKLWAKRMRLAAASACAGTLHLGRAPAVKNTKARGEDRRLTIRAVERQFRPRRSRSAGVLARLDRLLSQDRLRPADHRHAGWGAALSAAAPRRVRRRRFVIQRWRTVRRLLLGGDLGFAEAYHRWRLVDAGPASPYSNSAPSIRRHATRPSAATGLVRFIAAPSPSAATPTRARQQAQHRRRITTSATPSTEQWLDARHAVLLGAVLRSPSRRSRRRNRPKLDRVVELMEISGRRGACWRSAAAGARWCAQLARARLRPSPVLPCRARTGRGSRARARRQWRSHSLRWIIATSPSRYDRIVSIEMIEAVGERYWPTYFRKLRSALTQSGHGPCCRPSPSPRTASPTIAAHTGFHPALHLSGRHAADRRTIIRREAARAGLATAWRTQAASV